MKIARLAPLAAIGCALFLASCANTVRGIGKDVNATANAVEDSIE